MNSKRNCLRFSIGVVQSSRSYFSLGSIHFRCDDRALIIQRFQLPSRYGRFDETIHAGNFSSVIQQAVGGLPREKLDRHRVPYNISPFISNVREL